MPEPEPKARFTVRLNGPWSGTGAWARVMEDGHVELELFDHSEDAQEHFGNDVAWIYRIAACDKPRLFEMLESRTGTPIGNDQAALGAFTAHFANVHTIRDWLKEVNIPYTEEFDSWA